LSVAGDMMATGEKGDSRSKRGVVMIGFDPSV
jgi:hypothetical protein